MRPNSIWAYCPCCRHSQRFGRVETNHWFHAGLTVLTLGLWGFSWLAIFIGRRIWPWRCKQCSWNDPDFTKRSRRPRPEGAPPADGTGSEVQKTATKSPHPTVI